jgi:hypothetical protein
MKPTLTQTDVARDLSQRPCEGGFREACKKLPDWTNIAYRPGEMAKHGVSLDDITWVFLRPEVLGRDAFIEATCRIAERVLPVFEAENPDDNRPRAAIKAAREYRDGKISREEACHAAWAAEAEAAAAARAAWTADAAAARTPWTADAAAAAAAWAARAAARACNAARVSVAGATEQRAQIDIIEAVIEEYSE